MKSRYTSWLIRQDKTFAKIYNLQTHWQLIFMLSFSFICIRTLNCWMVFHLSHIIFHSDTKTNIAVSSTFIVIQTIISNWNLLCNFRLLMKHSVRLLGLWWKGILIHHIPLIYDASTILSRISNMILQLIEFHFKLVINVRKSLPLLNQYHLIDCSVYLVISPKLLLLLIWQLAFPRLYLRCVYFGFMVLYVEVTILGVLFIDLLGQVFFVHYWYWNSANVWKNWGLLREHHYWYGISWKFLDKNLYTTPRFYWIFLSIPLHILYIVELLIPI